MASENYNRAQRNAKNAYRRAVAEGDYPYLPALDDMIDNRQVRTEEPLGLVSIPLDQIVGTQCMKRGLRFSLLIFTKKKEDATGILVLGETQAKVMQRAIEEQAQGRA